MIDKMPEVWARGLGCGPGQRSGEEGGGTPESSRGQMKDERVLLGSGSGEVVWGGQGAGAPQQGP